MNPTEPMILKAIAYIRVSTQQLSTANNLRRSCHE
jgi:hypothetical protein